MKVVLYIKQDKWIYNSIYAKRVRVLDYDVGLFIEWGNDIEETENGVGTYTAALIECEFGEHKLIYAPQVKFLFNEPDILTQEDKDELFKKYGSRKIKR